MKDFKHQEELNNLILKFALNNWLVFGNMGSEYTVTMILHSISLGSLKSLFKTISKRVDSLSKVDELELEESSKENQELQFEKDCKELVKLSYLWNKHKAKVAREEAKTRKERQEKLSLLKELKTRKEVEELEAKDKDTLEKMIAELED